MLDEILQNRNTSTITIGFTNDTLVKIGSPSNAVSTSSIPTLPLTATPSSSTYMLATVGYIVIPRAFLDNVTRRLSTVEKKAWFIEMGVKPWVDNILDDQSTWVQRRLDAFELSLTPQLGGVQAPDLVVVTDEIS